MEMTSMRAGFNDGDASECDIDCLCLFLCLCFCFCPCRGLWALQFTISTFERDNKFGSHVTVNDSGKFKCHEKSRARGLHIMEVGLSVTTTFPFVFAG